MYVFILFKSTSEIFSRNLLKTNKQKTPTDFKHFFKSGFNLLTFYIFMERHNICGT